MKQHFLFLLLLVLLLSISSVISEENDNTPFSGIYTFNSRYEKGELYLCRQTSTSSANTILVQGTYVKMASNAEQSVIVGILEGTVDAKGTTLNAIFVDAGGVNGQIVLQEKVATTENSTTIELTGSYWYLNSKSFGGIEAHKIHETKIAGAASDAQCLTSKYDTKQIKDMSGTWQSETTANEPESGTWCTDVEHNSAVGDLLAARPGVVRAQVFLNGRVSSGVWMNSENSASFTDKTMGVFLRVRTDEKLATEIQWQVLDGNYFSLNTSAWNLQNTLSLTKTSDDIGSCVSKTNQMPWMGTFDLGNKRLLYVCYTDGQTLGASISSLDSKHNQQVRGSVYGTVSADGRTWTGRWYDITDKKPFYGSFEISLSENSTDFVGHKWIGDGANATRVDFNGHRFQYKDSVTNLFANDEQCKLAYSHTDEFEGTWTLNQPVALADNDITTWPICLRRDQETSHIIPYVAQKQTLVGIVDRNQAIATGNHETAKVISIIRRVDQLMESHFWDGKYSGVFLNAKTGISRPANESCFAIAKKDKVVALAVAVSVPVAIVALLFLSLFVFFVFQQLVKKRQYTQF